MAAVRVGDPVTVPGDMYGTVKFIGTVAGKKGTFAGVQLAPEFAPRGKNSGDVDGKHYFRTSVPGSGIFLPLDKAVKRSSGGSTTSGPKPSPVRDISTPTRLGPFNQGGRTPGLQKPSFSQSVGPGAMRAGAASPALKPPIRRESLPRPQSPLRKANTPAQKTLATPKTRPSASGFSKSTLGGPGQYRPGPPKAGNAFSQSLRQPSTTPSQPEFSPLGPEPSFDEVPEEEAESTPTPTPAPNRNADVENEEIRRLKAILGQKDRELGEQASQLAEMESSVFELQKIVPGLTSQSAASKNAILEEEEDLPRDVVSLRSALREKNEKIKLLTAEFDSNRADFRSTIDTLEMASTETERVYEKRVDELLEEVRTLQDRSEDVESVAQQLKQLEELVQELEEGLEESRRGEAEARGEVEFLRGEVERSRSEFRRERDRMRTEEQLNGYGSPGSNSDRERFEELQSQLDSKEDEIRGLKAIINNLNNSASDEKPKANGIRNQAPLHARNQSEDEHRLSLEKQISDLEALLQQKSAHQEELENEVTKLRNSVHLNKFPMPASPFGLRSFPNHNAHSRGNSVEDSGRDKHQSSGTVGSQRTVVLSPGSERKEFYDASEERAQSPTKYDRNLGADSPTLHIGDGEKSEASSASAALWCEICEEGGHDILTCGNMISDKNTSPQLHQRNESVGIERPAPLLSRKSNTPATPRLSSAPGLPPTMAPPPPVPTFDQTAEDAEEKRELKAPIEGTGAQAGMWAGKKSGVIDPEKWCALCERDGHDSVDCPIEDAF
jgi:hypothetical protein